MNSNLSNYYNYFASDDFNIVEVKTKLKTQNCYE